MHKLAGVAVALTTAFAAVSFAGAAEAGWRHGHGGWHGGHHHGWHGGRGWRGVGFGFYPVYYGSYYDYDDYYYRPYYRAGGWRHYRHHRHHRRWHHRGRW